MNGGRMLGFLLSHLMRFRHRRSSTQNWEMASVVASQCAGRSALAEASLERKPEIVEIKGVVAGVAVQHALGYRFVAADQSVLDMTESVWPTLDDLRRAVAHRRRAFLQEASWPFPGRRSPRLGAASAVDEEPILTDQVRLALNSFDW
jgi:hypothetical protein